MEVPLCEQGVNRFLFPGKSDRSADASQVLILDLFLPSSKVRVITEKRLATTEQGWHIDPGGLI